MTKKYNKKENSKASSRDEDYKTKKEEEGRAKKLEDLHLEEFEDIPLVGGLFKGLGKLIDLAEKVEKAGGKIERMGEIKGLTHKHPRAVWGFTVSTLDKDRKPSFRVAPFGNIKKTEKGAEITEEREPIVDVFDEKDCILVIAELPGVQEKDIKLHIKGDVLKLETIGERKYAKEILLPAKADFESRKVNFKNGILEIKLKKI